MSYASTFKAIDDILRNEAGCSNELDYVEQTSWLLFLKYLDDLENEQEDNALLSGKEYKRVLTGFFRWSSWASPKTKDGKIDTVNAMTGDQLVEFVDQKLFPELKKFKDTAINTNTIEYKIGEIFSEIKNKIRSGYNLREIINKMEELHFQTDEQKHEMSFLYEDKIRRMGNSGRNGGEYYTPRPLICAMVKVVNPQIGETVYDPACGSAGFLCEAFRYMSQQINGDTKKYDTLQTSTLYGKEKKPLPYIIAIMNMIFHGVLAPNILHTNTLSENLANIDESQRKNIILANPPFGGSERAETKNNFKIQSSETAYMFMQHFIKMLKVGGRAGIVIKNTFLSNGDASKIREMLLDECNLHTVLDIPQGAFQAGVKTVVLFFTKGEPTKKTWFYQLNLDRTLGKTNPLNEDDLADFVEKQKTQAESENSWTVDVTKLDDNHDLSVKNPNKKEVVDARTSKDIANQMADLNTENTNLLNEIIDML